MVNKEVWRWQGQIRVESAHSFATSRGIRKSLQVALRWQILVREDVSQWYAKSAKWDWIEFLQLNIIYMEQKYVLVAKIWRRLSTKLAIPVSCWESFYKMLGPQSFVCQVWLGVRPWQRWWYCIEQLVSVLVGAKTCWILRLIFDEQISQNTGLLSIVCRTVLL